jgi:ribosomal protein S12 methylthiotransferase
MNRSDAAAKSKAGAARGADAAARGARANPRIGIVSLGCPKALVDSERILTRLRAEGYEIAPSYQRADLVLVNTCGFIDSARAESLDAIGEALEENGKVVVTGCLGAEGGLIREKYPDVLAVTGPHQYEAVMEAVHKALPPAHDPYVDLVPPQGIKLTPRHYAYLKISEGCNHRCSFCIIPHLRGDLASRPIADVLREAERLALAGVKELLVISQDTSAYGVDIKHAPGPWRGREWRAHFTDLARGLGELGIWVRLHYVYPYPHVDDVIPLMAEGKILPYLDIPFQHASPAILKAMRRPANQEKTLERIARWRALVPEIAIRSTFIVGFPGETEADFAMLLDWLEEAKLDRVGCFKYEPVEGAAANALAGAVPEKAKEERWHRFMQAQQKISAAKLAAKVGREIDVIVDTVEKGRAVARSKADAPEIDGNVFVKPAAGLKPGDIVKVRVEKAKDYDLEARPIAAKR